MRWMRWAVYVPFLFLIGCSAYVGGYYYQPHPGLANFPTSQPAQPPAVAALASVIGVHYAYGQLPEAVEIRLRFENHGGETLSFDPRTLELTTGDLVRFPPALPVSPTPVLVSPGQSAVVTVDFPFPENRPFEQFNLDSLHLRWTITDGSRNVEQFVDFVREVYEPYYYDRPYFGYGGPYPLYGGVVVVHRF